MACGCDLQSIPVFQILIVEVYQKMNSKNQTWQPYITTVMFCILIFGFTAASVLKPSITFSETENRMLAQRPELKMETVLNGEFEADYEEYLTDQFILRDTWIGLKTAVERLLLKRESKDIYFAGDGYLIEKHTESFSTGMAQRNIAALTQFTEKYKEQFGAGHMTVMIVPNAVNILREKLPPFAPADKETDYLEQIQSSLPEKVWFDAASVLRRHADEELFYRTDHHWKTLAAFYVYQAWAQEQGYSYPALTDYETQTVTDSFQGTIQSKLGIQTAGDTIELFLPGQRTACRITSDDSQETKDTLYDYPALDTKDKYAVFFGGNQAFLNIRTESENGRKILVIKDSYANCFIPFMLREFQEIDVLDLRYTRQKLSKRIEAGGYTDLLILYNASGFAEDMNVTKLTN